MGHRMRSLGGPRTRVQLAALFAASAAALAPAGPARAFCGFYVSGADASLYNDATMVVLMREGTQTVLSMQNAYQGPPEDFALVVPVPIVLEEENVRTLPAEVFARVDRLAAPRLVEYWEQDPCAPQVEYERMLVPSAAMPDTATEAAANDDLGVTVEAEFEVGEYDIVILSANDSSGLDTWLRQNEYNIPSGADPVLRPYVEQGTKFFVAKVDPERVTFEDGRALLSPLRVHYDAETFSLPVRLGLLNSQGTQDLLVHVLARGQRYEVANYDNATIPTNLRVQNAVRESFGGFYDALFERVRQQQPRAVVTEYAWDASSCDPCPEPALDGSELMTLGADVVGGGPGGFVLTRLHYRYDREGLDEDLVFRAAPPIVGGRGTPDREGKMHEQDAAPGGVNNFQGRYVILHRWEGEVSCDSPVRGNWGGPPSGGGTPRPVAAGSRLRAPAPALAANAGLATLLAEDVPSLEVEAAAPAGGGEPGSGGGTDDTPPAAAQGEGGGCAGCAVGGPEGAAGAALFVLALGWTLMRRRD